MESRWLAVLSLVFLINFSFPSQGFSASIRAKKTVKQSHKQTQRKAIAVKPGDKKTKGITKKSLAKSNVRRSKGNRITVKPEKKWSTLATKRKTSKRLVHSSTKTSIWMTPIKTAPYKVALRNRINTNFKRGSAAKYSPEDLVRANVFVHYPLKGGIRKRSGDVRYLVLHSTETGRPADGKTIVRSWNNIGRRHPGTQYLVDRDGTIIQTTDPRFATVHVNDNSALRGVSNDNSIGIELVRQGKQKYTQKQLNSLVALVDYVKDRFNITRIYGHGEIQPSDRRDPVAFNWARFSKNLALIQRSEMEAETAYDHKTDHTDG